MQGKVLHADGRSARTLLAGGRECRPRAAPVASEHLRSECAGCAATRVLLIVLRDAFRSLSLCCSQGIQERAARALGAAEEVQRRLPRRSRSVGALDGRGAGPRLSGGAKLAHEGIWGCGLRQVVSRLSPSSAECALALKNTAAHARHTAAGEFRCVSFR